MSSSLSPKPPIIHVYGSDHSPWTQSVLIFLEYKQLKYTLNTTPDLKSVIHNKTNGNESLFQMPVLHYNHEIISESIDINKFIHSKHPYPALNESDITSLDGTNLNRIFTHAITRTHSRLFHFFYKWSLVKDKPTSFISLFFRPTIVYYFAILITYVSKKSVHRLAKRRFKENPQNEDINAYYPENTFIFGLKYFQQQCQRLYNHDSNRDSNYPSLIDFALLGQFQCLYSGLSDECIPLIYEHFPAAEQWLESMYKLLPKYNRLYSKNQITETNYFERVIYWIGFVLGFPVNILFASTALITRSKL